MTTSTDKDNAIAVYKTGKVKEYLERRDVRLLNVMMETQIDVGRLAEIVNGNYPATAEEQATLGAWALTQEGFEK